MANIAESTPDPCLPWGVMSRALHFLYLGMGKGNCHVVSEVALGHAKIDAGLNRLATEAAENRKK